MHIFLIYAQDGPSAYELSFKLLVRWHRSLCIGNIQLHDLLDDVLLITIRPRSPRGNREPI